MMEPWQVGERDADAAAGYCEAMRWCERSPQDATRAS